MTSLAFPRPAIRRPALPNRERLIVAGSIGVTGLVIATLAKRALVAGPSLGLGGASPWLMLHLASVLPALPLGAYLLARRKGDRRHRLLGRVWAVLAMLTALSSFGLHGMTGHLSWIHILSVITVIGVPRAIWMAIKGDIPRHRRGITILCGSFAMAGLFAFLPGRLFGVWLLG